MKQIDNNQTKILLGKRIKLLRKNRNLTQEEFSEKIGIEISSLSNIESGKSFPSLMTFVKISEILGVRLDELIEISHLQDIKTIEAEILEMVKGLKDEDKRVVYKILKGFAK